MVHFRDIRLKSNAGMDFPLCKASEALLDTEWRGDTDGDINNVTCPKCLEMHPKAYPWARQRKG